MMQMRLTPAVRWLLYSSVAMFIFQQVFDRWMGGHVILALGLTPEKFLMQFHFWQIISYSVLHGEVMHLVLNALMLVVIGSELESVWGTYKFLRYYLISVVTAGAFYLLLQVLFFDPTQLRMPLIGASGGIYGLLVAYGLLFSERTLLFMMLFPMKAKLFIWVLAGVEFMTTVFSPSGGLSGVAHLGGMAGGFLFLVIHAYFKRRKSASGPGQSGKNKKKRPSHLKLIVTDKANKKDFINRVFDQEADGPDDEGPKGWH